MKPTIFKKVVAVPLLMVFGTMLMTANSFDVGIFHYDVVGDGAVSVSQMRGEEGARLNPDPYVGELFIPSSVDNGGVTYSVSTIAENAFSGCSKLTSVSIPASIKAMRTNAFTGCTGLARVDISDLDAWCIVEFSKDSNPLSIAGHLYLNGEELHELIVPEDVTTISSYAFQKMKGVSRVSVGKNVIRVGDAAFDGIEGLKRVEWNAVNCSTFNDLGRHSLPFGTTTINEFIFGNDVEVIPNYICYGMTMLRNVAIPNSVKVIGTSAFHGCAALADVTIGNSVTSISDNAFAYCTSLTGISLPRSLRLMGNAFVGCSALSAVDIEDLASWCSVNFTDIYDGNPLAIAHHLTVNGEEVEELSLPSTVTAVGAGSFVGCNSLNRVTIPNTVTTIGAAAFYNCANLKVVNLAEGLSLLDAHAFGKCASLTDVYNLTSNPSKIKYNQYGVSAFEDTPVSSATLHIPQGTADRYHAIAEWNRFGTIDDSLEPVEDMLPEPEGPVSLTTRMVKLDTGQTLALEIEPAGLNVVWNSNNPKAATVDENGVITAITPGMAEISVTCPADGSSAWCAVFVVLSNQARADMNLDGIVDVGDVNSVLDIILNNEN